jgi:hypothetical protein
MHADTNRRQAFIDSLRACADFLESHPNVKAPRYVTMNVFVDTREELAEQARSATWVKTFTGKFFSLSKSFGEDVTIDITAERELVCRRVVTGTRVLPAQPERVVEDYTWECDEASVLGAAS